LTGRRRIALLAALVAALMVLFALRRSRRAADEHRTDAPGEQEQAGRHAWPGRPGATVAPAPPPFGDEDPAAQPTQGPGSLPPGPRPYPPGSQPLTQGSDPSTTVLEDNPVDDKGVGIHAIFGPRRDVVHPPDPIVVDLQVLDKQGKRLAVGSPFVRFHGDREARNGTGPSVPFRDDGTGADRAAGDLAYTVTYLPTAAEQQALGASFRVFVEVGFDAPNGLGPRLYVCSLHYGPQPGAELDGKFDEAIVDGSLVVGAGLTVHRAGQYKVIASLYGPDRETAIVFAQKSMALDVGQGEIPLLFFGKILRDRGIDGPYVLRYLMVFEEFPAQGTYYPGTTVDYAYTTQPYRAAQFSSAPYVEPPSTGPVVTAESPSQQNKPPSVFGAEHRGQHLQSASPGSAPASPGGSAPAPAAAPTGPR
jgi:hypothetical protein